jgi:peptidoglycan hydrolase CwlO-like protein
MASIKAGNSADTSVSNSAYPETGKAKRNEQPEKDRRAFYDETEQNLKIALASIDRLEGTIDLLQLKNDKLEANIQRSEAEIKNRKILLHEAN